MPGIDPNVTFDDVLRASARIQGIAKRTPIMRSTGFDQRAGLAAYFKCESLQTIGAFKIRGAANFLRSIPAADLPRGVVGFSSGNHAQAVAYAARVSHTKATLVMPTDAPKSKMEATRGQGAEIVTYDRLTEDRAAIAKRIAEETGATLVPPFDHPWIIAGQGTAALELLEDQPDLDAIVAPIGGGGLMSGTSIAARHLNPKMQVIGVEPEAGDDYYRSLAAGRPIEIESKFTIADGLRITKPGEITFPIVQRNVDRVVLVSDQEIRETVKFLLLRLKILVEPSGAASAAAVLFGKLPPGIARAGVILSGGNVDFEVLAGF